METSAKPMDWLVLKNGCTDLIDPSIEVLDL